MAFYGYKGDFDECRWNPSFCNFDDNYDPTPTQLSFQDHDFGEPVFSSLHSTISSSTLNYPIYEYPEPNVVRFEPIEYSYSSDYRCENFLDPPEINYSMHEYSEPKYLQYNPLSYNKCYFPVETTFRISYSTVGSEKTDPQEGFNEPEFEEYDPTPYGGGYDPSIIYGKPLPPSDKTCFPPSVPKFDPASLEHFSYSSTPSPYAADDDLGPNGSKVIDTKTDVNSRPANPLNGSKAIDTRTNTDDSQVDEGDKDTSDTDSDNDESIESTAMIPSDGNGLGNGESVGFGYEAERQLSGQIPYGSGLEAMDLCESIFGYWPCLSQMEQQEKARRREIYDQERRDDPWNIAADYLFGSPAVYDYEHHLHYHRVRSDYASNYGSLWMQF